MIRKTTLLAGVAGAVLFAAPALAQDIPAQEPAPATTPAPAQGSMTIQPGSDVKSENGARLGALEGVRTNDVGQQELEVRGDDGQLRAVPLGGLRQDGETLIVALTPEQYQAAPVVQSEGDDDAAPTPAPTTDTVPADPSIPAMPAPAATTPTLPTDPATADPTAEPTDPVEPEPATPQA
ncbi:MAG TPA: hypothetical protein PLQ03_03760 [Brevundimonas sp.]|uniref:hypothetical protein n=1 Tax=Brevundimonas sp. TaxID=1871086 RepID=UPI0026020115|nr:hypothetical protein [Brevundimonas sp.]HRO32507.1 hypothetical protein [Brevundimonas sp.]